MDGSGENILESKKADSVSFHHEVIVDDIIFNGQSLCDSSASSTTTTASSTPSSTPTPSTCDGGVYNSWDNNVQGTLKFTVPSDIASYILQLETDIHISNIQVSA